MTTESEYIEASNANVATFLAGGFVMDLSNITLAVPSCIVLSDLSKKLLLYFIHCCSVPYVIYYVVLDLI
jgi:hypothetical protein